jgi:polysaccharide export outer membrane protein
MPSQSSAVRLGSLPLVLAVVTAVVAACLSAPAEAKKVKIPVSELSPPQPSAAESLAYYVDELPYRVAPGDLLNVDFGVQLEGHPLRVEGILVRPDGMITLNPVGEVRAAGLTTHELDSTLTVRYVDVYRAPRVTVAVAKMAGNFVHVFGRVKNPGSYEVLPNATVLQAITRAGGTLEDASMGSVVLMRRTGPSSMLVRKVQSNRAMSQGLASQDPYVRRFDIIYVPRTTIGNINHFVDQFFGTIGELPTKYIYGWEAFNIERIFPIQDTSPRP